MPFPREEKKGRLHMGIEKTRQANNLPLKRNFVVVGAPARSQGLSPFP